MILVFLTALRDFGFIALVFVLETLLAIGLSVYLGSEYDMVGYFVGFLVAQLFIIAELSTRIFVEFPSKQAFDKYFFSFMWENKTLVFTGLFYNVAIWADKVIFWISPRGVPLSGFYHIFPEYDSAMFLAYITIIPTLSLFLIHIETDFYVAYQSFYARVLNKGTFPAIKRAKEAMRKSLRRGTQLLVTCQGTITILALIFAPECCKLLALPPIAVYIFRIGVLGAFLHGLLLVTLMIILYFDFKNLALITGAIFMVCNITMTLLSIPWPLPYLGYGYAISALITLFYAFYALDKKFEKLEYITFAMQPVAEHREEEIM